MINEPLRVGDAVELRVAYAESWSSGFEVAALLEEGYQVRRTSDGFLLPGPTGAGDIRRHPAD